MKDQVNTLNQKFDHLRKKIGGGKRDIEQRIDEHNKVIYERIDKIKSQNLNQSTM